MGYSAESWAPRKASWTYVDGLGGSQQDPTASLVWRLIERESVQISTENQVLHTLAYTLYRKGDHTTPFGRRSA
jgi:hypothetical protein